MGGQEETAFETMTPPLVVVTVSLELVSTCKPEPSRSQAELRAAVQRPLYVVRRCLVQEGSDPRVSVRVRALAWLQTA